ncbi:lysyl oxidase homolog 3A isoform X3 [Siphateles boraxobius]|uniref:lysyl oxidase homolog 3A isoform X3 n=1 Tax=Siphateles boraxobius TaxID=180520 RepID=UPI0040633935
MLRGEVWDSVIAMVLWAAWLPSCLSQTPSPSHDGKMRFRLAGYPRKHNEGRVEVFYSGEWGTICDDDFTLANAHVLCRHLGFVEALGWSHSAKYGPGNGKIWLDNVMCGGMENSIEKCVSRGWGNSDCTHQEDAGVVCKDERLPGFAESNIIEMQVDKNRMEKIRLRPLSGAHAGRMLVTEGVIEVKFKDGWGHICNTGWTTKNSRVVCGMMGFPSQRTTAKKPSSHQSVYKIHSVACTGNEAHLSACTMEFSKANSSAPCSNGGAAVVNCVPGPLFTQAGARRVKLNPMSQVRLKGGAKAGEGRVEVLKGSEWGTVCDDRWNLQSASVVCRDLGFGTAKEALTGARMGQGMGPIYMNEVQCHGDEKSLWDCPHKSITAEDCKHMEDASVICNIPYMGFEKTIRLTGGRTRLEGRVELLSTGSEMRDWGLICGDGWTTREAMHLCRQLGLGHASSGLRIRMVGGRTDHEGRVEVQVKSRWGTICSDNWTTREAMVACRQLGLRYCLHAITETWYWDSSNVTEMVLSGVKCKGDEMTLTDCQHHPVISCKRVGAQFSAGVICSDTASDLVLNAPLVEQSVYIEDRPLHMLYCAAEENCLAKSAAQDNWPYGHRRLLRFSSQIHNIGKADFRPRLGRHSWVWHECHRHYHSMDIFTYYDLLSLNGTKVADGHKASFCLEDTECHEGVSKHYECANFGEQGITVGCWDLYRHDIDCQWIDITDVKPGNYILQVIINPNFEVAESDFTNNAMRCNCKYDGNRVWLHKCHLGDSFSEEAEKEFEHYPGQLNNKIS